VQGWDTSVSASEEMNLNLEYIYKVETLPTLILYLQLRLDSLYYFFWTTPSRIIPEKETVPDLEVGLQQNQLTNKPTAEVDKKLVGMKSLPSHLCFQFSFPFSFLFQKILMLSDYGLFY
jgi:hypothetical protein